MLTYAFYVRAWYDSQHYAIYSSPGIKTDSSPPETSRSYKVKELATPSSTADVDFIDKADGLHVTWENVFRDAQSNISTYRVSLSTVRGGVNLFQSEEDVSVTSLYLPATLLEDTQYFVTVEAVNEAGLSRKAFSDGFQV